MYDLGEYGLPELPEGQFWRVTTGDWGNVELEIRRKRRWGSTHVWSRLVESDEGHVGVRLLTPELIRNTAWNMMLAIEAANHGYGLLGDYPPKRLP
jgi:hypothetical protein